MRPASNYALEVNPRIPPSLARLNELAGNLWYSWNRQARELFSRLQPQLWAAVGHNPLMLLRYIDEARLEQAALDAEFMRSYHGVLTAFDAYYADRSTRLHGESWDATGPVAYFCAEFGLHESLPIYSGGLGILAGDHCKTASDMRLPFVGVGLLYRQGYFAQTFDRDGNQIVTYHDTIFTHLPAAPVMVGNDELRVSVELPGRAVALRVWYVRAGHVDLYFLDADVSPNSGEDRGITYRLYGGDRAIRLEQELVLGVGGARALAALNIEPAVWHINEGHAAFLILERARRAAQGGVDFATAVESVAANTVFTTHTAVPAGHDRFEIDMMERYFAGYCSAVGIGMAQLLALGCPVVGASFDMTTLAIKGSRFHNAVSRIHAGVTARMLQELWAQIPADENPITYVTNAVHVPTFLASEWAAAFDRYLGGDWDQRLHEPQCIECLRQMPDEEFWALHQDLKSQMLHLVRNRVTAMHMRNHGSETHLTRLLRYADPENPSVLTIGFARRFATYKRAGLLLADLEWLRQILGRQDRPILFIFAGKAHPADIPGQDVIREIARIARMPEFEGKILLLEGYDLNIARRLVSGVDVWLNNPVFPLEASGTSGMKAGMNGVLNLSVLDGWWAEGYERGNGWAIKPVGENFKGDTRDAEEARYLYELLQDQVIPLYYERNGEGWPRAWIRMARESIITLLPRFGATRMVGEYASKLYLPAARRAKDNAARIALARELTEWKSRVRAAWPHVTLTRPASSTAQLTFGDIVQLDVEMDLAGLQPGDVRVELLLERPSRQGDGVDQQARFFTPSAAAASAKQRYTLSLAPEFCGNLLYYVRAYPFHERLAHRFELGLMIWA